MKPQNTQFSEKVPISDDSNVLKGSSKDSVTTVEIQAWLVSYIADLLEIEPAQVDVTIPFDRFGLDSSAAVGITGDLEEWLDFEFEPTLLYDYPTIEALTKCLAEECQATK